jgi:signal transduction histidine kinase
VPLDVDLAAVGTARIDPERTEQAIMVLIDNAAKFSPPERPVRLDVRLSDAELVISVEDRGPGIPDDLRPYVFDRFRRGDRARGRRQSGAGLGLSIAQVIVDGQGGRIDARDRPGGGTRMVIQLPRWGGPPSVEPISPRGPATTSDRP